jgi:hypothetical protein
MALLGDARYQYAREVPASRISSKEDAASENFISAK